MTHNIKTPHICSRIAVVCQATATWEKKPLLKHNVHDDTWKTTAVPLPTVAWIRKT